MKKSDQHDDPIKNYIEWSEHRYDPGHIGGGDDVSIGPTTKSDEWFEAAPATEFRTSNQNPTEPNRTQPVTRNP